MVPLKFMGAVNEGSSPTDDSHLRQSFSGIPVEVGGTEPEWAVFKASIAEAAVASCGLRVLGSGVVYFIVVSIL